MTMTMMMMTAAAAASPEGGQSVCGSPVSPSSGRADALPPRSEPKTGSGPEHLSDFPVGNRSWEARLRRRPHDLSACRCRERWGGCADPGSAHTNERFPTPTAQTSSEPRARAPTRAMKPRREPDSIPGLDSHHRWHPAAWGRGITTGTASPFRGRGASPGAPTDTLPSSHATMR